MKSEKINIYFTEEWNNFISEKVDNWINLFNRRLCNEDKENRFFNRVELKKNINENKENMVNDDKEKKDEEKNYKENNINNVNNI
jgi:hypothetical protein